MSSSYTYLIAAFGGILPALLWLWFWLREDKLHPEPRRRVIICFIAGMASVMLVLPFQRTIFSLFGTAALTFLLWAAIEEFAKYAAATAAALRSRDFDEPVDALIYMITAALGFAAIENIFFMLGPLLDGDLLKGLATGNMRFIGASLLHVAASAVLGFFIAETYFSSAWKKLIARIAGLILAIALHTAFNLFIMAGSEQNTLLAFGFVWIAVFAILFLFEKVKKLKT